MLSTRSKHIKRGNGKKTKKHYGGTGTGGASVDKELYKNYQPIENIIISDPVIEELNNIIVENLQTLPSVEINKTCITNKQYNIFYYLK